MLRVLTKVGLNQLEELFKREKITPDVVNVLSKHELEYLGVSLPSDMMALRMECIKYGSLKPVKHVA